MKQCHGCEGKGWVDSAHFGPITCPICKGIGQITVDPNSGDTNINAGVEIVNTVKEPQIVPIIRDDDKIKNQDPRLAELERWLRGLNGVTFDHPNKTMNTYTSQSRTRFSRMGLVWVYTDGNKRIHLRKGDYNQVDDDGRVLYFSDKGEELWGGYPQFIVETIDDIAYAQKLIEHAINAL
jgi:hypothetical protein